MKESKNYIPAYGANNELHWFPMKVAFSRVLSNANGGRIPISKETIHRAVDCLERIKKEEIDRMPIIEKEKEYQKAIMSAWMQFFEKLLVNGFYQQGLLQE